MTETQRERVPRADGGELDTTMAFLTFVRGCVLKKCDGMSDEQLRRGVVASGTSLLGLVAHLTVAERYWIGYVLGGVESDDEWDFGMDVPPATTTDQVLRAYRDSVADSDEIIRAIGDPDARTARPVDDVPLSMRWVLAHLTGETARHAGHADILREQLDGITGR